jgi:catechol 2,3-dioxygenase-like lactoylglutathione lyase family enzyme
MTGFRSSYISPKTPQLEVALGFSISGLNHLGLIVQDIDVAKDFFIRILGLKKIEDRGGMVFLMAGRDVLAVKTPEWAVSNPEHLKMDKMPTQKSGWQSLDHYGFYASKPEEVDALAQVLRDNGVEIIKGPYDRSDGRSVYFKDPCGNVGEYLYFKPKNA